MQFCVAIDGPAGAGKGTIAKALSERFGLCHLDTGLLYRAVGKMAMDQGRGVIDPGCAELIAKDLKPEHLDIPGLRGAIAARAASRVAKLPAVRKALIKMQQNFARRDGGAVMDGRDIGTVIAPDAALKLYVTASAEERARRRHAELVASGHEETSYKRVLADIQARDAQDSSRRDAPLKQASDAVVIDTTDMAIDDAVKAASLLVEGAMNRLAS